MNKKTLLLGYQPIFDSGLSTIGGELLFRNESGLTALDVGDAAATSSVVYNLCTGVDEQFSGFKLPLFINVSADIVESETFLPLDPNRVIIELLERIEPTPSFIAAVERWHDQGFRFAFDDFVYSSAWDPLLPYCDIIKIDISQTSLADIRALKNRLSDYPIKWLAERVETQAEFELFKRLGFDYYQGFFFSKPINVSGLSLPPSAINLSRIVQELYRNDVDFDNLASLLEGEPGLSIKLLKVANSSFFKRSQPINNLRSALSRLGIEQIKKWILLIKSMETSSPSSLVFVLTRASVCAELAKKMQNINIKEEEAFLAGLLSGVDLLMKVDKHAFIEQIDLPDSIKQVSAQLKGPMGKLIKLVQDVESAQYKHRDSSHKALINNTVLKVYLRKAIEHQSLTNELIY